MSAGGSRESGGTGSTGSTGGTGGTQMTAGTGVLHSEFSSPTDKTHLLQIWILPEANRLTPGYEQKLFPAEEKQGKLRLVASRGGDDGSVKINQDVKVFASILDADNEIRYELAEGRHASLQLISGSIDMNGETLEAGDGAAISDETTLTIRASSDQSEFLLFDLN